MTETDEIRSALTDATRLVGDVRARPDTSARLRRLARRRRNRSVAAGAAALSVCTVVAVVAGLAATGDSDGRSTTVPAVSSPPSTQSAVPGPAVTIAPGPRTLVTPIEVHPVVHEYLTLACPYAEVRTVPAAEGDNCFQLGPTSLVIRQVRDMSALLALTPQGVSDGAQLDMTLTASDKRAWSALSAAWLGKQLAFVVDGKVYAAPSIQTRLTEGTIQIELGRAAAISLKAKLIG